MHKRIQVFILFNFLLLKVSLCQHHVSFQIPAQVCLGESLEIQNTSDPGLAQWNFCPSLNGSYTSSSFGVVSPSLVSISIIESSGVWIGFAVTRNNELLRLNFGDNPANPNYTISSLGNPGGLLNSPDWIHIIESNGKWFALVTNNQTNEIIRLVWNDLGASPVAQSLNLSGTGNLNGPAQIEIELDGSDYVAIVANSGSNQLTLINFGQSMENMPGSSDVILSPVFSGSINMYGVTAKMVCGQWVIYTSVTNKMYKVNVGTQLFSSINTPQIVDFSADIPIPIGSYVRLKSVIEGGDTYVYFTSYTSDIISAFIWPSGATNAVFKDLTNLVVPDQLYSLEVYNYNNSHGFYTGSFGSGLIHNIGINYSCPASQPSSTKFTPTGIYFNSPGNYSITLSMKFPDGFTCSTKQQVVVNSLSAPDIAFTETNNCVNNGVFFSTQNLSQDITLYSWDFGDGGSAIINNPTYSYSNAGIYSVRLLVTASNSCQNFIQKDVQIFNLPQANFTLPAASPICTNQNYLFTNTSTFDSGSSPTWQWNINGTNIATTQDLNYLIATTANQNITLSASIPGCSSLSTQSITTVQDGPLVDFTSPAAGCLNTAVPFTNATTGSVTSYQWTFGDGNSSTQTNASNVYNATGTYGVTLTTSNAVGCQNLLTKNISVYSNPQPDFAVEAPPFSCANYPAQFDNNTPSLSDSNIATWAWTFGDVTNGTSNQKNPAYTYTSAATYPVTLQATTNFGCIGTKQQSVVIYPSPQAAFTNNPACENQATQFTDASTGSIASYKWAIQSTILTGATPPPYVFKSAGTFPVTLTTTGNNGCKNIASKDITVPVPPVMDFTFQPPCTGKPTIFQELNPGGSDPSVAWNWNFGSDSGTNSPVSYSFITAGGYSVTLSATRKSGCVYSTSRNITIYEGPVPRFAPSIQAGPAPLVVTFVNTSTADSYFWEFGDDGNSSSSDFSPIFTYLQLGQYKALLTASNSHGCSDTLSTEIYVVVPRVDLSMKAFSLVDDPNTNSSKAVVTISNLGNTPQTNPEVQIDLGGNARLKERITSTVLPGKSIKQTLSLEIVPQTMGYICAAVASTDDVDIYNDRQCLSLTGNDILYYPYPNPANGQINFDWISAENENVAVTIYKSSGQIAFEQNFQMVQTGINQLAINTSLLASGLYLIQFSGVKVKKTFSVMVAHE